VTTNVVRCSCQRLGTEAFVEVKAAVRGPRAAAAAVGNVVVDEHGPRLEDVPTYRTQLVRGRLVFSISRANRPMNHH
jgi:hypothetical protein